MAVATTARWLLLLAIVSAAAASGKHERWRVGGQVVEKERRRVVAESEAGSVSAVDVADAAGTAYRLHFITMDPGALFLPVQLHADMVFYVHSGRGKVTSIEEESSEQSSLEVERGDVYNFEQGSILYIQSYPNASRQRLRIYAIFTSEGINADDPSKPKVEAYSSVSNLVKGFETDVLRLGFGVQSEVVEAIKSAKTPPPIIAYNPEEEKGDKKPGWRTEDIVDALLGLRDPEEFLNKKKKKDKHKDKKSKSKAFNFYSGKPDVQNCYGWSRAMTSKDLDALHGSSIGMFMVNLTTGSMMGPHWNPKATEIAIVTEGSGIVQTVCPSSSPSGGSSGGHHHGHKRRGGPGGRGDEGEGEGGRTRWQCRNSVFRVKEGDVFVVPRFHPMAQMSFNDDSFVFVGFSTHMGQNHPQFLAGKGSVLQAIGKKVLALALGQRDPTAVDKLLSAQRESTILPCVSCAEELAEKAEEERKRREEEGGGKGPGEREKEKERREREEKEKEREEEEREREREEKERKEREREEEERREEEEERARKEQEKQRRREKEEERARRREEEEREREEEEERRREEEEGGGGRGDEPEREEEGGDKPPYRLSKKLKKRYHARAGMFSRSG
ncbi:Vicilin-like seed storage protein [Zea mays]|uniref:Vicilin-like seed storage protein n=1 Tax=Zea mays TaxID=4577 RepID=A0A3L6DGJ0_MAIZE|nr:Vicilin-like seed storage protein [Zea mays]